MYLLNASNIYQGGSATALADFARHATASRTEDWCFAVSGTLRSNFSSDPLLNSIATDRLLVLERSPARSRRSRRELKAFADIINPEAVFTFMGPAYVKFRHPHLCGVVDGWLTHADGSTFRRLGFRRSLPLLAASLYRSFWFRRCDSWATETEIAAAGLANRLGLPAENISIVGNTCSESLILANMSPPKFNKNKPIKVLLLAAAFPHKRIELIPRVAAALQKRAPGYRFLFQVTLPSDSTVLQKTLTLAKRLQVLDAIQNLGPLGPSELISAYEQTHLCFAPSIHETFSATGPEAMACSRPMAASDFAFHRDVLKDAALYFPPDDAEKAAECLARLAASPELRQELIKNGHQQLGKLPDSARRYQLYLNALQRTRDRHQAIP